MFPVSGVKKGILKKPESPGSKKGPFVAEKNDKHDLLIAEFKKAHLKMFGGQEAEQRTEEKAGLEIFLE